MNNSEDPLPWPREAEDVVVALEVLGPPAELGPPEVLLLELALLDHRPHGAVQHVDPPRQRRDEVPRSLWNNF